MFRRKVKRGILSGAGFPRPKSWRTTRQETTMIVLYILAYVALIACVAIIVAKMVGYLKKPMHLRWEI